MNPKVIRTRERTRPMSDPALPAKPDPATVVWGRVAGQAAALCQSLDRLDELGGSPRAAEASGWTRDEVDRATGLLLAAREGLAAELTRLGAARRKVPKGGRAR